MMQSRNQDRTTRQNDRSSRDLNSRNNSKFESNYNSRRENNFEQRQSYGRPPPFEESGPLPVPPPDFLKNIASRGQQLFPAGKEVGISQRNINERGSKNQIPGLFDPPKLLLKNSNGSSSGDFNPSIANTAAIAAAAAISSNFSNNPLKKAVIKDALRGITGETVPPPSLNSDFSGMPKQNCNASMEFNRSLLQAPSDMHLLSHPNPSNRHNARELGGDNHFQNRSYDSSGKKMFDRGDSSRMTKNENNWAAQDSHRRSMNHQSRDLFDEIPFEPCWRSGLGGGGPDRERSRSPISDRNRRVSNDHKRADRYIPENNENTLKRVPSNSKVPENLPRRQDEIRESDDFGRAQNQGERGRGRSPKQKFGGEDTINGKRYNESAPLIRPSPEPNFGRPMNENINGQRFNGGQQLFGRSPEPNFVRPVGNLDERQRHNEGRRCSPESKFGGPIEDDFDGRQRNPEGVQLLGRSPEPQYGRPVDDTLDGRQRQIDVPRRSPEPKFGRPMDEVLDGRQRNHGGIPLLGRSPEPNFGRPVDDTMSGRQRDTMLLRRSPEPKFGPPGDEVLDGRQRRGRSPEIMLGRPGNENFDRWQRHNEGPPLLRRSPEPVFGRSVEEPLDGRRRNFVDAPLPRRSPEPKFERHMDESFNERQRRNERGALLDNPINPARNMQCMSPPRSQGPPHRFIDQPERMLDDGRGGRRLPNLRAGSPRNDRMSRPYDRLPSPELAIRQKIPLRIFEDCPKDTMPRPERHLSPPRRMFEDDTLRRSRRPPIEDMRRMDDRRLEERPIRERGDGPPWLGPQGIRPIMDDPIFPGRRDDHAPVIRDMPMGRRFDEPNPRFMRERSPRGGMRPPDMGVPGGPYRGPEGRPPPPGLPDRGAIFDRRSSGMRRRGMSPSRGRIPISPNIRDFRRSPPRGSPPFRGPPPVRPSDRGCEFRRR